MGDTVYRKCVCLLSSVFFITISSPADARIFGGKHGLIRGDVGKAFGKTEDKVRQESKNAVENTVEAADTLVKTAERQVDSLSDVAKTTGQLLRDGKPGDALIHLATEPYKSAEKNTLRAVQESSMLRMAGQFTANTFAPGIGGALVTTWYVGRTTGNIEDALKAGAVSYSSSSAFSTIGEGPVTGWGDGAGRAAASGVVGGTGTAIMGGRFEDGFESAAFASTLKSGVEAYSQQPLDPKPGTPSISKGTTSECGPNLNCTVVDTADDMRAIPSSINNLGKANPNVHASDIPWDHEGSEFMSAVNQVPGMNALSHPHDVLATDLVLDGPVSNAATIIPTGIATYTAMGTERDQELLNLSVKDAEDRKSD